MKVTCPTNCIRIGKTKKRPKYEIGIHKNINQPGEMEKATHRYPLWKTKHVDKIETFSEERFATLV